MMRGKLFLMVLAAMTAAVGFAEEYVYAFDPRAVPIPEGEASASKLVFASDGTAGAGTVSYYRHTFNLSATPTKAMLTSYFDDSGKIYVNGHDPEGHRTVTAYLVAGENTIAIRLFNNASVSATVFTLECDAKDGSKFYIHSGAETKGTVVEPASDWNATGFDDSGWPAVNVLGDVLSSPWRLNANYGNFKLLMTEAEKIRYEEVQTAMNMLPAGLDQEPDPVARVVYRGRRPYIELNGKLHDPTLNITPIGDPYNDSAIVRCGDVGFDIVNLCFRIDEMFKGEGNPCDFSSVDTAVRRLLWLNPNAKVVLSMRFTHRQWAIDNPDEQVGYDTGAADPDGDDEFRERVLRPSAASDRFRALVRSEIREFAGYVERQPWRKRLVGLRLSYGVYSEWCCYGFNESPDTGLRMQEKFRAYELAKRGIADASVPTAAQRQHVDPVKENDSGDLLDPAEDQLVLDYYEFLANTMADLLLDMAHQARQSFPGRLIGAYYGYLNSEDVPEGANVMLDKVLASPDIDFLSNPPVYHKDARRAGGSYGPRSVPTAFRRYGKLSLLEDDSRFHHIIDWLKSDNDGRGLCTTTPRETEMDMRRNWLNQFFDGDGIQLNDPITQSGKRPHAFDDPAVFKAIAESKTALAAAGEPADESGNKVAVLLSGRERLRRDGGKGSYFTWNIYLTPLIYMYRSGVAFDFLTLEDYLANPRDYKILVFLNAFYLTDAERAVLIERTRKSDVTAVWFGPAGGVTDAGFDDAKMSELTGITLEGAARRPRIVSKDSEAVQIPNKQAYVKTLSTGARCLVVPDFPGSSIGGGALAYREILEAAGAWLYTDTGSYFRRHGDVFMFHTGTAGTHTIRLPDEGVKVRELFSGTEYDSNEITLETDGPNTWLFKLSSAGLWSVGDSVVATLNADGVLTIDGTGAMRDFAAASDVPWDPSAVKSVVIAKGVTVGANAFSALSDTVPVNGLPLGEIRGGVGGAVPSGMVLVSKTELEAAGAATLEIAEGTAVLGVRVCTNATLESATSSWKPVVFAKSDLAVSADGTLILAPVPAGARQGFMVLRSGD